MGQIQSGGRPTLTKEQLSDHLAVRFLHHSFSEIEAYSFKDNFISLAQETYSHAAPSAVSTPPSSPSYAAASKPHKIYYWTEDTLTRFLGLPDALHPIGAILYHSATYLGAFPFEQELAPVILTFEALVRAVALMTGRHEKVLRKNDARNKKGGLNWVKVIWSSFAVWEREVNSIPERAEKEEGIINESHSENDKPGTKSADNNTGMSHDNLSPTSAEGEDEDNDDDDDEELTLAALEALDAIEAFELPEVEGKKSERSKRLAHVPFENMQRVIILLLLVAPLNPTQSIAMYADRFTGEGLVSLKVTSENILRGFTMMCGNGRKGVPWRVFKIVIQQSMTYLFDGFLPLFEHFIFSKNVNMSHNVTSPQPLSADSSNTSSCLTLTKSLLPTTGQILTIDMLTQISFFIPGSRLWHRLRPLYAGSSAGFSMGSFETHVLKWHAPTILLVSGQRIPSQPQRGPERTFADSLPQRRYSTSAEADEESSERLVFGVYLNVPWKLSHKECFGDVETLLFQLEPVHEVFRASRTVHDYAHFNKNDGIAFGNQLPNQSHGKYKVPLHSTVGRHHHNLGPVSLTLDEGFEYGVFNHISDGGAFFRSDTRHVEGDRVWQDRFEIEEVEVWGLGGDKEAEEQRRQWAWEEKEALSRRSLNLGKDIEADRALLEMAGLIGQNRSGGSVG